MQNLSLPVGISDFKKIRENGYYYIDKTGLISELLKEESTEITLITRPRRFGKTLGMSMLANFFDIRKDSKELYRNLQISEERSLCKKWMNQYPTIFLSFKDVDGLEFESAREMLFSAITELYKEHLYLLDSPKISSYDKELIQQIVEKKASVSDFKTSLFLLIRTMHLHYQKPVILLFDEYDVPIAKASSNGYYKDMLEIIKTLMSTSLKDNPALKFAVITGCLKIAKESIFTGTNNFVSDTITDSRLNEYFGFTQDEVNQILQDSNLTLHASDIKEWYDGYHFGKFDIYCPWDVMNYIRDLQYNPDARPVSYWKNTSDNAIIRSFIDYAGSSITKKLESLLSGDSILQQVDEELTYDYLHSSEDNLWSILYLTGYLTKTKDSDLTKTLPDGMSALIIPNAEVKEIFKTTILKWFQDKSRLWNRKPLFDAVWNGNSDSLTKEMSALLRMTISYHDYKEDFYHAFLAGIFAGAGYMVESNREHGEGRSDVIIYDSLQSRVAIFEAKHSNELKNLEKDCEKAIRQIDEKRYAKEFEDDYDEILCYGIAFYKKRCVVKKK